MTDRPLTTDLVSHTPGPWDIQSSRTTVTVRSASSGEVISSWYAGHPTGTVTHANARLIAAAPELLEVVKRCTEAFGDFQKTFDKLGQPVLVTACAMVEKVCKLVLDKAEGRS